MYIQIETKQYPLSERDIREANPNTSFAEPFQPPDDYAWVFPAPQPTYDPITHAVREIAPADTIKGHWEQQWEVVALDADTVAANQANSVAAERAAAKVRRDLAVAAIKVTTTSGKTFDGDEESQQRMARAIIGLQAANILSMPWTLADNTRPDCTLAELTEAMLLAGRAQSDLWAI